MQLNDVIARRREQEALIRIAAMAEDDQRDLDEAAEAVNELGALIGTGRSLMNQAKGLPGANLMLSKVAPLVDRLQAGRGRLIAPLQRFGTRSTMRRKTCESAGGWSKGRGAVTATERKRTVPTKTPIFARLHFKAGALSDTFALTGVNDGFRVFNLGRGDQVGAYGYAGSPACTPFHTNLLEGGTMRPKAVFVGHGIGFLAENVDGTAVVRDDLAILGRGLVNWTEDNDTHKIAHPRIGECPMPYGITEHGVAAGRTGAFWSGEPYLSDDPLMRLRGAADQKPADKGHSMLLTWEEPAAELSKAMYLYCYLLGEHLQGGGGK